MVSTFPSPLSGGDRKASAQALANPVAAIRPLLQLASLLAASEFNSM